VIAANRSGGQIGYTPAYSGVMGNPYGVIASSANKKEAFEYLNYMLNTPKAAAEYMELTYYAVPNTEALKLVSPEIVDLLPTSPKLKDKVYIKDYLIWRGLSSSGSLVPGLVPRVPEDPYACLDGCGPLPASDSFCDAIRLEMAGKSGFSGAYFRCYATGLNMVLKQ
jgi:ABC-type glycerol-3-phosphate transport system substrate-binding protein